MSHRNLSFVVCVCLAASVAAFGQANQGTGYLFQYPGYPSTSAQFLGYVAAGNLSPIVNTNGPAGISRIIPKPDGSKFYLVGTGSGAVIQSVDSTFTKFNIISGLGAAPNAVTITPDGKYLLIAADAFYIVDTSTDSIVSTLQMNGTAAYGTDETGFCLKCWIAVSRDSSTAYVLANSSFGSQVNTYNLTAKTRGTTISGLSGDATSITISPLGLIYVTASNRIFVIDPSTLQVTSNGTLELFDFEPNTLHFTSDGTTAYATNRVPALAGESMLQLNLTTNNWTYWPPKGSSGSPSFDDVYVASNTRLFAYSSAQQTLYDVTTSPFGAVESTSLGLPKSSVEAVGALAISNEVPAAKYLFLLVNSGNQSNIYREDLSANSTSNQALASLSNGMFQYAVVPPESGAATFLQFNNPQTLNPGTTGVTSAPLIARIMNAAGQPIYNLPVTITGDSSATGITINNASPTTNSDGYVQTTVSVASGATCPNSTCTITVNAGSATVSFTLNLPVSTSGGGGGGGTTSSQIAIVSGDGQLLQDNFIPPTLPDPLTVLVTDTNGNPLPGVAVNFSVVTGTGGLDNPNATTDANGLAYTDFFAEPLQPGNVLQSNSVTAVSPYGTATFTELVFHANNDTTGAPQIQLLSPSPSQGFSITMPEGSALSNGIVAQIYTTPTFSSPTSQPIPGVSIFTVNTGNPLSGTPPASCQGATNADATGTAHCTLVASCQTGSYGLTIEVGNYANYSGTIDIVGGSASKLAIASGNNQSGIAGQALQPLIATITDGCNNAIAGVPVTWTITQGSATLGNTIKTTNSAGQVSTGITLGQTPGTINVRLSSSGLPNVNFTLTDSVIVSSISLQSGAGQTAVQGVAFTQPLTFIVKDNTGNPLPGVQVTFAVASGSANVNPASATSNAQGLASTTVTAGTVSGAVVITGAAAGFTATANLTVQTPGPSITSASFYNAASFQPGLVPCGLATVIGNGIAPGVTGVVSGSSGFGPLPYFLGGLSMTIGGVPVPLYSISNQNGAQQATFQTPCETAPGTTTVTVAANNGSPTTIPGVPVAAAQPGIFTYAGPNNIQYGAVIRALDGSYVTPSNLAHRGETYFLVATGLGQTTPPTTTNSAGIAGENVAAQVIVGVNNAGVPVTSAQYLAGSIGVYIVGFQIPATAPTGTNQPLAIGALLSTGQVVYGNPVFLPGVQ